MGTNVKKVVRNILCVAGVIILLVLSSVGGMYIERNHQETLKMQKEHISTIAVINMDDGIAMYMMRQQELGIIKMAHVMLLIKCL